MSFMLLAAQVAGDTAGIVEAMRCGQRVGLAWENGGHALLASECALLCLMPR